MIRVLASNRSNSFVRVLLARLSILYLNEQAAIRDQAGFPGKVINLAMIEVIGAKRKGDYLLV